VLGPVSSPIEDGEPTVSGLSYPIERHFAFRVDRPKAPMSRVGPWVRRIDLGGGPRQLSLARHSARRSVKGQIVGSKAAIRMPNFATTSEMSASWAPNMCGEELAGPEN
jgi:hypothetical protein